jgi:class 3 adenylate cyclase/pimeloyl-ACP methyl ester carboxylesterase
MSRPETHIVWNGDISLAYQVLGQGAADLLYLQGYSSQVDLNWDSPYLARFLRGLAGHSRLIVTDRRGWGCSDRFSPSDVPDVDALTDDILTVLDAVGSSRAAILASFECAIVGALFAATYPDHTLALILVDPMVAYLRSEGMPWMPTQDEWEEVIEEIRNGGTGSWSEALPEGPERDWFARLARATVTTGAFIAELRRHLQADVRAVLPTIQVPTLVFADTDGEFEVKVESGRMVAGLIPGARLIEQSSAGGIHRVHWYARGNAIVQEVGRFLGRIREEEAAFDRVLATVLFTDIVDSTKKAAELGDRGWREVLQRHNSIARALLARYRGKEVDTAGDGFFATFDGPARAVRCARAIVEAVRPLGLEVRAGVHTGEVETIDGKAGGIAVSTGARVAGLARPAEVLVSGTVKDLVAGSGLEFEDRGDHQLKGVPGSWRLYAVTPT